MMSVLVNTEEVNKPCFRFSVGVESCYIPVQRNVCTFSGAVGWPLSA